MRFPRFIAAALAALLVCAGPALALAPYDTSSTVTASTTHQSVALASPALAVEAFNAGAVVAYVELGGTAASAAGRFIAADSTLTAGETQVGLVHMNGNISTTAAGPTQAAAAKLRITTTGTPGAGVIRCTVFSEVFVGPTS